MGDGQRTLKPVGWIASSKKDFRAFPDEVQDEMGLALLYAQEGGTAPAAKPLRHFGGADVMEIVADHGGDAYRTVYTVRFEGVIYVLHAFKKKSKRGIATPKKDVELIWRRLRAAEEEYKIWLKKNRKQ